MTNTGTKHEAYKELQSRLDDREQAFDEHFGEVDSWNEVSFNDEAAQAFNATVADRLSKIFAAIKTINNIVEDRNQELLTNSPRSHGSFEVFVDDESGYPVFLEVKFESIPDATSLSEQAFQLCLQAAVAQINSIAEESEYTMIFGVDTNGKVGVRMNVVEFAKGCHFNLQR